LHTDIMDKSNFKKLVAPGLIIKTLQALT